MFKFDNRFLDSVGLTDLPESQKEAFLQYAQDQLEIRIGEKMSENLTNDELDEFENIIDNDADTIQGLFRPWQFVFVVITFNDERHADAKDILGFVTVENHIKVVDTHGTEPAEVDGTLFLLWSQDKYLAGTSDTHIEQTSILSYFMFRNRLPERVLLQSGSDD